MEDTSTEIREQLREAEEIAQAKLLDLREELEVLIHQIGSLLTAAGGSCRALTSVKARSVDCITADLYN